MIIDTTFFSYGAGLVMVGWLCGAIFRIVINVIKSGTSVV